MDYFGELRVLFLIVRFELFPCSLFPLPSAVTFAASSNRIPDVARTEFLTTLAVAAFLS